MEQLKETTIPSILLRNGTTMNKITFSWYDYTLFNAMLVMSALIGIYFGCFGKKQTTANEYLLGGKTMKVFPIAMSLIASKTSAIDLLAIPADVYRFGCTYWLACLALIIVAFVTNYVYLPVFYNLEVTSAYEYLKVRFDTRVRVFASFLFAISVILYLPIVIYVPSLALAQATDFNIYFITPLVCSVCIFYTTIGGLRAVVWTDMLQFSLTIGALLAVFYLGIVSVGGISEVFTISWKGQRLDIDFDINPTKRDTFWAMIIGWTFTIIANAPIDQSCVQKYLSVPTLADARKTVFLFITGMIVVKTVIIITGLVIYTKYSDCDPLSTGIITKPDQLLTYYVMDVASHIPGLTGLFIAGVFCAAFSTLSVVMNCLAGTLYEDFIARYMSKTISQKTVSNILKFLVVIIGLVSTCMVFIVDHLGGILPIAIGFSSITAGPLLSMFTLGMLFPKATSQGAFYGGLSSLLFVTWVAIGAQWYNVTGTFKYTAKPVYTDGCEFEFTPMNSTISAKAEEVFFMYRISHYYYAFFSVVVGISHGLIVSLFTKDKKCDNLDIKLFSPVIHFLLNKEENMKKQYFTVDKAMHMVTVQDSK